MFLFGLGAKGPIILGEAGGERRTGGRLQDGKTEGKEEEREENEQEQQGLYKLRFAVRCKQEL